MKITDIFYDRHNKSGKYIKKPVDDKDSKEHTR